MHNRKDFPAGGGAKRAEEGYTLRELIDRQAPWLRNERNVIQLLRTLVEIAMSSRVETEVTCRLRPEDILISGPMRRVEITGCELLGNGFTGIVQIADELIRGVPDSETKRKLVEFRDECIRPETTGADLTELLDTIENDSRLQSSRPWMSMAYWTAGLLAVFVIALLVLKFLE